MLCTTLYMWCVLSHYQLLVLFTAVSQVKKGRDEQDQNLIESVQAETDKLTKFVDNTLARFENSSFEEESLSQEEALFLHPCDVAQQTINEISAMLKTKTCRLVILMPGCDFWATQVR